MTIFFQQSGKRGEADFHKTLSYADDRLRYFTVAQLVERFGFEVKPTSFGRLDQSVSFQIWGVPSGARRVMELMRPSDLILLIGQLSPKALEYGRFYYAGRVVHVQTEEDHRFSRHLWGEGGFPLIFFSQGSLVNYTWTQFQEDFGFSKGYYEAGNIKRVLERRLLTSRYKTEDAFAHFLGIPENGPAIKATSDSAFKPSQVNGKSELSESTGIFGYLEPQSQFEGERAPAEHYDIERSSAIVDRFKSSLEKLSCEICHFDFQRAYGEMGRGYIEAHHIKPLSEGCRLTTVADFLAVCANCHRMLHRNWPHNDVAALRACFA